jgi:transaldolase
VNESYFHQVKATTPTRLWVNNPTVAEIELALAQGAVGCTTNPSYGGGLLKRAPGEVTDIIAACIADDADDEVAAEHVQQVLVHRIASAFLPLWQESGGRAGFVSLQGAPERDTDGEGILREAHEARAILPNVTPKIPATLPGFHAFEQVVAAGYPTIVTEVFCLDQVEAACERYLRVTEGMADPPPFHMSPITGIFSDHLRTLVAAGGPAVDPVAIEWTGVAFARACRALVEERSYPVTLLFGGARTMRDFTGLVGEATAATINYSTVAEILAADPPVEHTIHDPVDPAILAQLDRFDDFRRAMRLGSLAPEEFAGFGPVQHFRDLFIAGWNGVLASIARARATGPAGG